MTKLLKLFVVTSCFMSMAISQVSDEEFILENMEMLEALEILESDVNMEHLEIEIKEDELENKNES